MLLLLLLLLHVVVVRLFVCWFVFVYQIVHFFTRKKAKITPENKSGNVTLPPEKYLLRPCTQSNSGQGYWLVKVLNSSWQNYFKVFCQLICTFNYFLFSLEIKRSTGILQKMKLKIKTNSRKITPHCLWGHCHHWRGKIFWLFLVSFSWLFVSLVMFYFILISFCLFYIVCRYLLWSDGFQQTPKALRSSEKLQKFKK